MELNLHHYYRFYRILYSQCIWHCSYWMSTDQQPDWERKDVCLVLSRFVLLYIITLCVCVCLWVYVS